MSSYVEIKKSASNSKWRWNEKETGNHKMIGGGQQSFESKANAIRAAINANPGVKLFVVTAEGSEEVDISQYVHDEPTGEEPSAE